MELEEIEVVIEPDGTTRIEVRGVGGPRCLEVTADLEAALGGEVTARELSAEAQAGANESVTGHQHRHRHHEG